jgi:4-diphosphocytidyl-2-C-methyl-D-erythritol kinase
MSSPAVRERAYAKLNLVLRIGRPRGDGLHPLCSLFASIDLADDVEVRPAPGASDSVECHGVVGPNLAAAALAAFRERVPSLPPLRVHIAKRIPVAAGLGGGSADAAAVLRAANRIAGTPLDVAALREVAAQLGSDVPSQVEPRHALVHGVGEIVEPVELPALGVVLVAQDEGLSTAAVYRELDRMKAWRADLDHDGLRELAAGADAAADLAAVLDNDLQPAALALRPELVAALESLQAAGALGALVSGSGPTCFGLFPDRASAESAAEGVPRAVVAGLRPA